jgi:hypothetical protein
VSVLPRRLRTSHSAHLLISVSEPLQFGIRQVLNVDHLVVRLVDGLNDLVQLQVNRLGIAVLGVLDQENDKKCYDRRSRVDDQLPSIRIMKIGSRDQPDQDREQSDKERPFRTDPVGSQCCKNMESFFFATALSY